MKGGAVVAQVPGEGNHVVGGVGEPQHVFPDKLTGSGIAEPAVVIAVCHHGQLLHDVPIKMSPLRLLPDDEVHA